VLVSDVDGMPAAPCICLQQLQVPMHCSLPAYYGGLPHCTTGTFRPPLLMAERDVSHPSFGLFDPAPPRSMFGPLTCPAHPAYAQVPLVPAEGALGAQGAEAASWEDLQVGGGLALCSIVWCPSVVQCLCDRLMAQLASIAWQLEMLSRCFLATCHARPWLQALLEETADQPVAGNQLVAVLRQLQGMMKRCAVLCCDLLCCAVLCCAVLHWCLDVLCCAVLSQGSGFSCCGASRSAAPLPVRVGSTSPSIAGLLEYCNDSCLFLPALRRLEMVLPTGDGCLSRPCSLLPLLLPAHRRFEMVMPADDGYQEGFGSGLAVGGWLQGGGLPVVLARG